MVSYNLLRSVSLSHEHTPMVDSIRSVIYLERATLSVTLNCTHRLANNALLYLERATMQAKHQEAL